MRLVSDSDTVRRQNRGLVLATLRERGALTRTQLAAETGLSHASITAITQDMLAQEVLVQLPEEPTGELKPRGRPPVLVHFNRHLASLCLVEIVNRVRLSLVDYGGTLIDRIETPLPSEPHLPVDLLAERVEQLRQRNPAECAVLRRVAVSVQGILDRRGEGLKWSPVAGLEGHSVAPELSAASASP